MKNHGNGQSGGKITHLDMLRDKKSFSSLAQIEAYWEALRGKRVMPLRSEIDPRGLKGALENCFILERVAPGIARIRVAGSHLSDLLGMEVRGMPITSFLSGDARRQLSDAMEEVFETPSCATIKLTAQSGFGRPPMTARMILMPVRSDLGDTSRILGGLVADGDIGRAPRRFSIDTIVMRPLVTADAPAPQDHPFLKAAEQNPKPVTPRRVVPKQPKPQPTSVFQMGEDAARFEPAIPGVSYLRVVKD